jgi:hypothetical protein
MSQSAKRCKIGLRSVTQKGVSDLCDSVTSIFSLLGPNELGRCAIVCRNWSKKILDNPWLWRLTALNIARTSLHSMETALSSILPKKLGYRNIAKGLARGVDLEPRNLPFPGPSVSLTRLVLLVEITLRNEPCHVGTWIMRCRSPWRKVLLFDRHKDKVHETERVFSAPMAGSWRNEPSEYGAAGILDEMCVTARLFRCDTGQSFCLFSNRAKYDGVWWNDFIPFVTEASVHRMLYTNIEDTAPDSSRRNVYFQLRIELETIVPPINSPEEPAWLQRFRDGEKISPGDEDLGNPWFEYRIAKIRADFRNEEVLELEPFQNQSLSDDEIPIGEDWGFDGIDDLESLLGSLDWR